MNKLKLMMMGQKVAAITHQVTEHIEKRCIHCKESLGTGDNIAVEDFIIHLVEEHPQEVEFEKMRKFLKKIGSKYEIKTVDTETLLQEGA